MNIKNCEYKKLWISKIWIKFDDFKTDLLFCNTFLRDMSWYHFCLGIIFVLVLFFRVICVGIMLRLKYSKSFPSLFRRQIETNKIGGSQTKTLINYPAALHYYILRQIFQTFKQIQIQISRQIQINSNTRRKPDQNFDPHYWDQLFPDMTQFFVVDKFKYIY